MGGQYAFFFVIVVPDCPGPKSKTRATFFFLERGGGKGVDMFDLAISPPGSALAIFRRKGES